MFLNVSIAVMAVCVVKVVFFHPGFDFCWSCKSRSLMVCCLHNAAKSNRNCCSESKAKESHMTGVRCVKALDWIHSADLCIVVDVQGAWSVVGVQGRHTVVYCG